MQSDYAIFGEPYRRITFDTLLSAFYGRPFTRDRADVEDVGWALELFFLPRPYAGF